MKMSERIFFLASAPPCYLLFHYLVEMLIYFALQWPPYNLPVQLQSVLQGSSETSLMGLRPRPEPYFC